MHAGHPLAFASAPYATQFPHPSWAEQDPADWWSALGTATRQAMQAAGVSSDDIAAMCVDTTCCTVVALDQGELRAAHNAMHVVAITVVYVHQISYQIKCSSAPNVS